MSEDWLDTPVDNLKGAETPREWLAKASVEAIEASNILLGDREWLYALAVTMVPTYPEIVLSVDEAHLDHPFSFDWKKVESIIADTLYELIST